MVDSTEQSILTAREKVISLTAIIPGMTSAAQAEYACGVVEGYLRALGDMQVLSWPECNRLLLEAIDTTKAWQTTFDLDGGMGSD